MESKPDRCGVREYSPVLQARSPRTRISRQGFPEIGIAFCVGLHKEAGLLADVFEGHGFEVISVGCKTGGVEKETIGIKDSEKIRVRPSRVTCPTRFPG